MASIDITAVTLTELRYVLALFELRHFGKAAEACGVTQPTLSAQIKKLESTLGQKLFERGARTVAPTKIGEELVNEARRVVEGMERILDLASGAREPLTGPLRLGMIPTLGPYYLPFVAPLLRGAFPKLQLVFRELKTADMLGELAQRELDIGVLALPTGGTGLASEPIFDEPFWLLVPRGHALAKKRLVEERDLEGENLLLLDEGHCLREQALSVCSRAGVETATRASDFRATSIETLRHMVAAGMGCTLLPALTVLDSERVGDLVAARSFADPGPSRRIGIVWRKSHPRHADHRRLAAFLRAHLPANVRRVRA